MSHNFFYSTNYAQDVGGPQHGSPKPEMIRGTGRVFPKEFKPSSGFGRKPLELFSAVLNRGQVLRHVLPPYKTTLLLMTDGSCRNNGHDDPRAGWAFVHGLDVSTPRSRATHQPAVVSARLEELGPWGGPPRVQTSNRAELRAVIAALRFRDWEDEGFETVVIATDSSYVVEGATRWTKTWVRNGWQATDGPAKNRDLWELLLGECERADRKELAVCLWKIPRDWNLVADYGAKKAAARSDARYEWFDPTW